MTEVRWDRDRESRTGVPEVVYGPGKKPAHLRQIFENTTDLRMASRLSEEASNGCAEGFEAHAWPSLPTDTTWRGAPA